MGSREGLMEKQAIPDFAELVAAFYGFSPALPVQPFSQRQSLPLG